MLQLALDDYFPVESDVTIIAEVGRFFVQSAFTLITRVMDRAIVNKDLGMDMLFFRIRRTFVHIHVVALCEAKRTFVPCLSLDCFRLGLLLVTIVCYWELSHL